MTEKGVPIEYVAWIESFLRNRQAQVRLHGISSSSRKLHQGVPQGCVLSPLLFLQPPFLLCKFVHRLMDYPLKSELKRKCSALPLGETSCSFDAAPLARKTRSEKLASSLARKNSLAHFLRTANSLTSSMLLNQNHSDCSYLLIRSPISSPIPKDKLFAYSNFAARLARCARFALNTVGFLAHSVQGARVDLR